MLAQRERCGRHRQKVYTDTFTSHSSESINQPIEQVCRFVQLQEPEELKFPSEITGIDLKENRSHNVLRPPRLATQVACVPSANRILFRLKESGVPRM